MKKYIGLMLTLALFFAPLGSALASEVILTPTETIQWDPDKAYNERRDLYRAQGLVVKARAIVQTAEGDKTGLWTTALAAAVFIL